MYYNLIYSVNIYNFIFISKPQTTKISLFILVVNENPVVYSLNCSHSKKTYYT